MGRKTTDRLVEASDLELGDIIRRGSGLFRVVAVRHRNGTVCIDLAPDGSVYRRAEPGITEVRDPGELLAVFTK